VEEVWSWQGGTRVKWVYMEYDVDWGDTGYYYSSAWSDSYSFPSPMSIPWPVFREREIARVTFRDGKVIEVWQDSDYWPRSAVYPDSAWQRPPSPTKY